MNTWEQAWDLVRRADQANLGLILDSFHTLSLDGDPRGIADLPGKRSSCRWPTRRCWQWTCWNGAGTSAASRVRAASTWQAFAPVVASGYRGPLSLEVFNDGFRAAPTRANAVDGLRSLLYLEEKTRERLQRQMPHVAVDELFAPPPASLCDGIEFLEFAVDDARRAPWPVVAATGLRQGRRAPFEECQPVAPGRHQPGTERRALFLRPRFLRGPWTVLRHRCACVTPARRWARSCVRRPAVPRTARPQRAGNPGGARLDGSLLYLVDRHTEGRSIYDSDFVTNDADTSGLGLRRVDHVALALPAEGLDSWVLFYKSLFDFGADDEVVLPDPMAGSPAVPCVAPAAACACR